MPSKAVFMMVKGINAMKKKEEQASEEPSKPSEEVVLMQEILEAFRK